MARTLITQITDDLDGSKDAKEVTFAYDGTEYTIDLSKKNRAALEKALAPYVEAGSKVTRRSATRKRTPGRSDLGAVRDWAQRNGVPVSNRGRIAQSVIDQYDSAK